MSWEHHSISLDARKAVTKRLAACCLEANKEAKLVERKTCLIFGGYSRMIYLKAESSHWQSVGKNTYRTFMDGGKGLHATSRNSIVSSDSPHETGHVVVWSASCRLFKIELVFSSRVGLFLCDSETACQLLCISCFSYKIRASQVVLGLNSPSANARDVRDMGLILGSGRSPGEGNGTPLQWSCLENPIDRRAWAGLQSTRLQSMGSQRVEHVWIDLSHSLSHHLLYE